MMVEFTECKQNTAKLIKLCYISDLFPAGIDPTGSEAAFGQGEKDMQFVYPENVDEQGYSLVKRGNMNIYMCQLGNCRRLFGCKRNIERHIKIHTGEKPYKCSFCDYRSARKDHLKLHEMKRHKLQSYPDIFDQTN